MFSKQQIKHFVRDVKKEFGGTGWALLVDRLREAVIAEYALFILAGQHADTIPTKALTDLRYAMLVEAGLREAKEDCVTKAK